jgi:hypothetical protein
MRTLQKQIGAVWAAQQEDLQAVTIELALAVTAVRVLDLEIFEASAGRSYRDSRSADRRGAAINGMTLVRNAEIHMPVTLDSLARSTLSGVRTDIAAGTHENYEFMDAVWQPYDALPDQVRESERIAQRCHSGYQTSLELRRVTETLFQAFTFYAGLAPEAVSRDARGGIHGFPLKPARGTRGIYYRMHPDEPPTDQVCSRLVDLVANRNPPGAWREIHYAMLDPQSGGVLRYAGYEERPLAIAGERNGVVSWVDFPDLLLRDVSRGYRYYFKRDSLREQVAASNGALRIGEKRLEELSMPAFPERPDWWSIGFFRSNDTFEHAATRGVDWRDVVQRSELHVSR